MAVEAEVELVRALTSVDGLVNALVEMVSEKRVESDIGAADEFEIIVRDEDGET